MYRGDHQRYTGQYPAPPMAAWGMHQAPAGHCGQCGQSSGACCCGCRECRKESKELLVTPVQRGANQPGANQSGIGATGTETTGAETTGLGATGFGADGTIGHKVLFAMAAAALGDDARSTFGASQPAPTVGVGQAFIGGGCCVSLTAEYTPSSPTVQATVVILVRDSEGTLLAWMHSDQPGGGYKVKEGIITTKPGATLFVLVLNATARVRWCEIFSC